MREILDEWGECILYMVFGLIVVSALIIFMKVSNGSWSENIIVRSLMGQ